MKNKHDQITAKIDSCTLVFKSTPTSVAFVSDTNALAGLRGAARWIRNSPVLCEVYGNARLSGFCCESHPPIAVLIPDAAPNDTETEEPRGREGEKVLEKLSESYTEDAVCPPSCGVTIQVI